MLIAMPTGAAAELTVPRTLDEYLGLAREANVSTRVASTRALVAREHVGVAKGYPDPFLAYGYYTAPAGMQGRQEIILQQEIPFPGKLGLRGDIAARQAGMAARMADAMVLDVDFEIKSAFYMYVGLTETARALEAEAMVLRRMREVAQIRYSSGTAEQQNVLKVELALLRVADETTVNTRETVAVIARLNELIGRAADTPLPEPVWVLPDVSMIERPTLVDSALASRPEIAGAKEEIAMARASFQLARREYVPDLMLGFDYEFGIDEQDWWEVMAGINIPIWIGKQRSMVREAEAMQRSAGYRLEEETLRTHREVHETLERARAAHERFERFKTSILPQAEAAFSASEASYQTGRVDFLDYLDSERMLLEMRKEYAMVIADLGIQLAALQRAVGVGGDGK